MKKWVEERTQGGEYANSSDYVRDLIRQDQQRAEAIARLQAEIDKGRASGISDKSLDEIVREARAKGIAALKARDAAA
jgi:antitoxin ParD1/3/4